MLIVNLDNTVLNVALPTLVRELRATSSQLQWIVDTYALVFAGLLLAGITAFAAWERASSHPMLNLGFFRIRSFSAAVSSPGLAMFGLLGALFLLAQFLQFHLGYSALQDGARMLPLAATLGVIAPISAALVRPAGTKLTAAGLLAITAGLWQISQASVTWTFTDMLPGMIMLGIGAAVAIPSGSGSVMGSVPSGDTGIGSATNGLFIQLGGALAAAVIGSLLSTRYQDRITASLAPLPPPARGREHRPQLHRQCARRRRPGRRRRWRAACAPGPCGLHQRNRPRVPRCGSGRAGEVRSHAGGPAGNTAGLGAGAGRPPRPAARRRQPGSGAPTKQGQPPPLSQGHRPARREESS